MIKNLTVDSQKIWYVFIVLYSLLYSGILSNFPIDIFYDRVNYLNYAENSDIIIGNSLSKGIVYFIVNEPLWLIINLVLGKYLTPQYVVHALIFFTSFLFCINVLRFDRKAWIFLIACTLFFSIVKNYIIHLRQGVALTFFLTGYFSKDIRIKNLLMLSSVFIHSSFFIILSVLFLSKSLSFRTLSSGVRLIIGLILIGSFSLMIPYVSSILGARQALSGISMNVSGIGFLFWLSIFVILISSGSDFLKENMFALLLLTLYLGLYFVSPYSGRIFESGLVIVLFSFCNLSLGRKKIVFSIFGVWWLLTWFPRFSLPWFGFSI